jgi:hypothetical protein
MLLYLLAVTIDEPAASGPPIVPTLLAAPPHNYLHPPADSCGKGQIDEIVVCGARDADKRYRLQPIDSDLYADAPIRAETNLLGGTLGVGATQAGVGGFPSNRIMLTFKIKF